MYKNHRFDLLGSGWVKVGFYNNAPGFEGNRYDVKADYKMSGGEFLNEVLNKRNLKFAKKIWHMIDSEYTPIDWQKDYKSGYRWSAKSWYRPQEIAKKSGGDIKVPWELSRLQHLPRLAYLCKVIPNEKNNLYREYRNELLDFIAQNPIRYGVNYMCTMDVGIRTANIVLAYSMFKSFGIENDDEFELVITNYVFELCEFIYKNLEWSYFLTSNHYFADVAGLLFGSACLPKCKKREKWLQFAIKEVKNEIVKQFNFEGTNREGSTAYHRLTGEMPLHSVALIHLLSKQGETSDCGKDIYDIIYRSGQFLNDITRPDNLFSQIGDNDSGLFFRLSITGELTTAAKAIDKYHNLSSYIPSDKNELYLDENMNDGRTFISAVSGMFQQNKENIIYPLERSIINGLMGEKIETPNERNDTIIKENKHFNLDKCKKYEWKFDSLNLVSNIHMISYPKFGLYIFKSDLIYLCVNATDNGQKGNAGHAHNDKLSFELFINGKCITEDPGTYVYTASEKYRNLYRSTKAHNTLYLGREQNRDNGMFSMMNDTVCKVIDYTDHSITLFVEYGEYVHLRRISVEQDKIIVEDNTNGNIDDFRSDVAVTRGYGKMLQLKY